MKEALGLLNISLEKKTCWSAGSLLGELSEIHLISHFSSPKESLAFKNAIENFENYVNETTIISWGRNKFRAWFIENELPKQLKAVEGYIMHSVDLAPTPGKYRIDNERISDRQKYGEPDTEDLITKYKRLEARNLKLETENTDLKIALQSAKNLVTTLTYTLDTLRKLLEYKQ